MFIDLILYYYIYFVQFHLLSLYYRAYFTLVLESGCFLWAQLLLDNRVGQSAN